MLHEGGRVARFTWTAVQVTGGGWMFSGPTLSWDDIGVKRNRPQPVQAQSFDEWLAKTAALLEECKRERR